MKKKTATSQVRKVNWEAVCERTRQRCDKLSDDERRQLHEEALRIIYSGGSQTSTRRR
jgi:hypothetical protein